MILIEIDKRILLPTYNKTLRIYLPRDYVYISNKKMKNICRNHTNIVNCNNYIAFFLQFSNLKPIEKMQHELDRNSWRSTQNLNLLCKIVHEVEYKDANKMNVRTDQNRKWSKNTSYTYKQEKN